MHMADSLLSPAVGITMGVVSAGAVAYSIYKINKEELPEKKLPLMAVAGAFVFAAQMINFTIPGTGSSGHIGGGILLAGLLGQFPALLTISAVLLIQCLFFADGGLLALGCNIFNMGVVPCLFVYPLLFKLITRTMNKKTITIASISSVAIGLPIGAFCVVLETMLSGITQLPFSTFVLLMIPIHIAIGLVEGVVTAMILDYVYSVRAEILDCSNTNNKYSIKKPVVFLAVLTIIVGGVLSMYASSYPDGLEWSIEKITGSTEIDSSNNIQNVAGDIQSKTAFMPDYDYSNADENGSTTATSVAGIVGSGMTFVLAGLCGFIIYKFKNKTAVN